jgi:hypothetical protein
VTSWQEVFDVLSDKNALQLREQFGHRTQFPFNFNNILKTKIDAKVIKVIELNSF